MKSVFAKLCPGIPEFSAKANIGIYDSQGALRVTFPMNLALTGDSMRQEFDVMGMMQIPPEQRASAKLGHLDKIVIITRIDKKQVYTVFPGVEAYSENQISDALLDEINVRTKMIDVKKTELGSEMVDGHSCTKIKVTVTEPNHPTEEAILWCATDLQQFPIKMEISDVKNRTTKLNFQDVQIKKPEASFFEEPKNFILFSSVNLIVSYAKDKQNEIVMPK